MRKSITLLLTTSLLGLPALAKIPEQGALFSLTRFVDNKEHKLAAGEELSAGSVLQFHAQGIHQSCILFVLPFQRGKSREIKNLEPKMIRVQPDEHAHETYRLKEKVKAGELFVVVVPTQSDVAEELTRLLVDWRAKPKESQGPRIAFHDRVSSWLAVRDKKLTYAGPPPKELGGVRSISAHTDNPESKDGQALEAPKAGVRPREVYTPPYQWRKEANWLPCSATEPGVFVYPLGK